MQGYISNIYDSQCRNHVIQSGCSGTPYQVSFTISVFCFNICYYPISKIWFSILEMLSLHYILHKSCPVLVLWLVLQKSTKKTIPRPFHSWFIFLIPENWYITNIYMWPEMFIVHGAMRFWWWGHGGLWLGHSIQS